MRGEKRYMSKDLMCGCRILYLIEKKVFNQWRFFIPLMNSMQAFAFREWSVSLLSTPSGSRISDFSR